MTNELNQLDPNQLINPPWIVKIIENDWKEYFSLEGLTNAKCRTSAHHRRAPEKNLVMSKNGTFKLETVLADTSTEHLMDASSWREAINRMCDIVDRHLPGRYASDVANRWRHHAEHLQNRSDFKENFHLYLLYDIRLRRAYVHEFKDFLPNQFQWLVWENVKDEQRDKRILAVEATMNTMNTFRQPASVASRPHSMAPNFYYPTTNLNQSFRSQSSALTPSQATRANTGHPPTTSRGAPNNSAPSAPRGKCYICLSADHTGRACTDTTNGFLTKSADGKWLTPSNQSICFGYNGILGCQKTECPHLHGCSKCGSGQHSVQSHNTA